MSLLLITMRLFSRRQIAFVWLSSLMLAIPTAGAEQHQPLVPQEQVCPVPPQPESASHSAGQSSRPSLGSNQDKVSPNAVIAWLLDEHLVRDVALDTNGDGNTLVGEKIRALTEADYCGSITLKCSETDKAALSAARKQLQAFADADGGPGYVIERLDRDGNVLPGNTEKATPDELLTLKEPTVQIRCVALPKQPKKAQQADQPYWHENGDHGFRLSGDIDDLSKGRGSLGAVKAAELSITSDLIEDETAYRVNAVAGYAFNLAGGNDVQTSFIPFLEVERVTSGSETQIDTLGAGFQQAATVNWPDPLRSEFAITPLYRTDSDFESQTGTLKFRWTPTLAQNPVFPLGFAQVYGLVELHFGFDVLADAGRVFDEGDQGNLDGQGNFLRLGNRASAKIQGAPGTMIRQFALQLSNRYLYNVDAEFDHINQFAASLAYLFPGNEHYQLSFAYSNGRDENSLELFEYWQTQFGIRF